MQGNAKELAGSFGVPGRSSQESLECRCLGLVEE